MRKHATRIDLICRKEGVLLVRLVVALYVANCARENKYLVRWSWWLGFENEVALYSIVAILIILHRHRSKQSWEYFLNIFKKNATQDTMER